MNHLKMENCNSNSNEDNDNNSNSNLKLLIFRILIENGIIFEYLNTSSIGQLLTSSRALLKVRGMNN